jgi:hypothetical protein
MATPTYRSHQAPEFPFWPFACLSLYTRVARDLGSCAEAVARSNDAMDAVRAETEFGAKVFADLARGYYNLALAPWTVMAAAVAEEMQAASAPQVAATAPLRRPRGRPHRGPARPSAGPAARRGG